LSIVLISQQSFSQASSPCSAYRRRKRAERATSAAATLVSEAYPFSLSHHPPGGVLGLRVPRVCLARLIYRPEDRCVLRIPRTNEALQLLAGYVKVAWHAPTSERGALQQLVVMHLHDLIALAVGATSDASEVARSRGPRSARLKAVKDYIAHNLDQPALSVAARHGCTERGVQRAFEAEDTTFTEFVLDQRLARAYRLLSDPREHEKITAIALDCGFGDVSYFNRVFRRRFGLAPPTCGRKRGVRRAVRTTIIIASDPFQRSAGPSSAVGCAGGPFPARTRLPVR
jgi:AraC-like DNA-binding protein